MQYECLANCGTQEYEAYASLSLISIIIFYHKQIIVYLLNTNITFT